MSSLPVLGNLISPADSDVEGGVGAWVAQTGGTLASSTTEAYSGTHSLRWTSTATGLTDFGDSTKYTVTAGKTYTLSVYMYPVATAFTGALDIDWYNGSTFLSHTQNLAISGLTANQWNLISISGTAPASTTLGQPFVGFNATATGQVSYFDLLFFGIPVTARPRAGMTQAVHRAAFW